MIRYIGSKIKFIGSYNCEASDFIGSNRNQIRIILSIIIANPILKQKKRSHLSASVSFIAGAGLALRAGYAMFAR